MGTGRGKGGADGVWDPEKAVGAVAITGYGCENKYVRIGSGTRGRMDLLEGTL